MNLQWPYLTASLYLAIYGHYLNAPLAPGVAQPCTHYGMRAAQIKKHQARHLVNVYLDDWLHLVHILSHEQSGTDILSPGSFPRQLETMCSILQHWKQCTRPQLLSMQSLAIWPIHPQQKQFTLTDGSSLGGFVWPLWAICAAFTTGSLNSASSLMMVHVRSSNWSIGVPLMLVDTFNSCFTQARSPATNVYTKLYSGNPPNRTASFFSTIKKTSTVSPAINVQVVKRLYTVQGSIAKALYSAALVNPKSAFSLSLNYW